MKTMTDPQAVPNPAKKGAALLVQHHHLAFTVLRARLHRVNLKVLKKLARRLLLARSLLVYLVQHLHRRHSLNVPLILHPTTIQTLAMTTLALPRRLLAYTILHMTPTMRSGLLQHSIPIRKPVKMQRKCSEMTG